MLFAPGMLLEYMLVPYTAATPLLLRVMGAVQLYGAAASHMLKVDICERVYELSV